MSKDLFTDAQESSWYAFTSQPLEYYVAKFQRRIFRRLLEYQILNDHLKKDFERVRERIRALLSLNEQVIQRFDVKDHIEKACLTGLKTEFELFFTIYCTLVLDQQIKLLEEGENIPEVVTLLQQAVKKDEFAKALL